MSCESCVCIPFTQTSLLHTQGFGGPASPKCFGDSYYGKRVLVKLRLRLMLTVAVLQGPVAGATCIGQSVVSDYGLLCAHLFPLCVMITSQWLCPEISIPSCRVF